MMPAARPFGESSPFRIPSVSLDTYIRLIKRHLDTPSSTMCVVMPLSYIPHLKAYYHNMRFEQRGGASSGYMRCKMILETPTQAQD